ncbi:MAG: hypothetical protein N2D54_13005 [Chloroflexota bacterium]
MTNQPENRLTAPTTKALSSTPTKTPVLATESPPLARLLANPQADTELVPQVQRRMENLVPQYGLTFERFEEMAVNAIPPKLFLVVAVGQVEGLNQLAELSPGTQFIAININGVTPASNITLINSSASSPAHLAFLGGHAAAMLTDEWRIGGIGLDNTRGNTIRQAFINGARYFCGLCIPEFPPLEYPKYIQIPPNATAQQKKEAVDGLIGEQVNMLYISPGVGDESLDEYLAKQGVLFLGNQSPSAGLMPKWVMTIEQNQAVYIEKIIRQVLAGENQENSTNSSIIFSDINPNLITNARIEFLQKIVNQIELGIIDPLGE